MIKKVYILLCIAIFISACTSKPETTTVTTTERVAVHMDTVPTSTTAEVPVPTAELPEQAQPPIKEIANTSTQQQIVYKEQEVKSVIPTKKEYNVPFTSQAPFANWQPPYDEACEEASMLMVARYIDKQGISPEQADKAILDLVEWQTDRGYTIDITAQETVEVLKQYFGYDAYVSTEVTVDRIKKELAEEKLVIIPAAGRLLGNPYFSGEGPVYHMLVITGYTDSTFITNDPGTKRGDGYQYDQQVVINAIHDWDASVLDPLTKQPSAEKMKQTRKAMVLVPINQ